MLNKAINTKTGHIQPRQDRRNIDRCFPCDKNALLQTCGFCKTVTTGVLRPMQLESTDQRWQTDTMKSHNHTPRNFHFMANGFRCCLPCQIIYMFSMLISLLFPIPFICRSNELTSPNFQRSLKSCYHDNLRLMMIFPNHDPKCSITGNLLTIQNTTTVSKHGRVNLDGNKAPEKPCGRNDSHDITLRMYQCQTPLQNRMGLTSYHGIAFFGGRLI